MAATVQRLEVGSGLPMTLTTVKNNAMAIRKCMVEPATATDIRRQYDFWR